MAAFDPYHRWLGIPPNEQPPDHYRLLGLARFENDSEVIENAANQRMSHLRSFQSGQRSSESQRLLNEVAVARVCLLNADKKAAYDEQLRQIEVPPVLSSSPSGAPPVVPAPQPPEQPAGPSIHIKESESWVESHLHGHGHGHGDSGARRRPSRGILIALAGSVAALGAVILIALFLRGGRSSQATIVFDLPDTDRDEICVIVDGLERSIPERGPLELACEPGSHEVRAERRGYPPSVASVVVNAGESYVVVPNWGEPTELVLAWPEGDREEGRLLLDGIAQDLTSLDSARSDTISLPVEPGKRTVRIERPGFETYEQVVLAEAGKSTTLVPSFVKPSDSPPVSPGENGSVLPPDLGQPPVPNPFMPRDPGATPRVASAGDRGVETTGGDTSLSGTEGAEARPEALRPVPSVEAQTVELARVNEAFVVAEADTNAEKVEVARRMLQLSAEASGNPIEQYVLLCRGQELAAEAAELELTLEFIAAKAEGFEIDRIAEQASALAELAASVDGRGIGSLVDRSWETLDAACLEHRYDVACELIGALDGETGRGPWQPYGERVARRRDVLEGKLARWRAFQSALSKLDADAEDPIANAVAGRWHLVDGDEPAEAFPFMAKIQQAALASLAKDELTPPEAAEEQAALGDRWWSQSEEANDPSLKEAFRARAVHWYKRARPNLTSVVLGEKIAGRLKEIGRSTGEAEDWGGAEFSLPSGTMLSPDTWVDLLASVDPLHHTTLGMWVRRGTFVSSSAGPSQLMLPVVISGDYELEVQFSHVAGRQQGLQLCLPVGRHACNVLVRTDGRSDVLLHVDGQPYMASVPELELSAGQSVTAKISVTSQGAQKRISVQVNNEPYFEWQGDEDLLACTGAGRLPRLNQPGLMNNQEQLAIHSVRFRLVEGKAGLVAAEGHAARPYIETGEVGEISGTAFEDFAPQGAVLAGLRYVSGNGLPAIRAVYRTADGRLHDGVRVGAAVPTTESAIARDGYAVGALLFETQKGLTGVRIRFHRMGSDGLDPGDTYDSPLIGQRGLEMATMVETGSRPAVGVHGVWRPGQVVSLGLVSGRPEEKDLWLEGADGRSRYLSLTDLDPIACFVAPTPYSRGLGVGTANPLSWPIISEDSVFCREHLYAPAPSRFTWKIGPAYKSFSAIGYCVESRSVQFRVSVDGQTIYQSEQAGVAEIKCDLPAGEELTLEVDSLGNSSRDESYWVVPRLHSRPAEKVAEFDGKEAGVRKLVELPPLFRETARRVKSHEPLGPLYPVDGDCCSEFLYAHPPSRIAYRVPADAKRFSAIAYCLESKQAKFGVSINGQGVYKTGAVGIEPIQVTLPRQAKTIELWIEPRIEGRVSASDQAFWCFPRFGR